MSWKPAYIREQMRRFLALASKEFYGGGTPNWDGTNLVVDIQIDENDMTVNANLSPFGGGYGVLVSELFTLMVEDQIAQVFVLGHEYGHGMTETVMQAAGLTNLSGPAHEVIADLISAYILSRMGIAPDQLVRALETAKEHVFNTHANQQQAGHHPEGDDRISYIQTLNVIMEGGHTFPQALFLLLEQLGCS